MATIDTRRAKGVELAWRRERDLVRRGRGTRPWTTKEQKQLLTTNRIRGYHGHHMLSVSKYPQYADHPNNVQFLSARKRNNEHLCAHRLHFRNPSEGRYNIRTKAIRRLDDAEPRAMRSYPLDKRAIDQKAYAKYAAVRNTPTETPAKGYTSGSKPVPAGETPAQRYAATRQAGTAPSRTAGLERSFVKRQSGAESKREAPNRGAQPSPGKSLAGRSSDGQTSGRQSPGGVRRGM